MCITVTPPSKQILATRLRQPTHRARHHPATTRRRSQPAGALQLKALAQAIRVGSEGLQFFIAKPQRLPGCTARFSAHGSTNAHPAIPQPGSAGGGR